MITGLYAGLCGLLLVMLYVRVSQRRLAMKIGMGAGGDAVLEQRIRAHGNFIESVPIARAYQPQRGVRRVDFTGRSARSSLLERCRSGSSSIGSRAPE